MDSAFAWIGQLVDWFAQFFPHFKIIPPNEKAIRFDSWRGKTKALGPGFHWYWPLRHELQWHAAARQTIDLRPQVITLADGHTVLIGGLITYEIADIEKALNRTWDPDNTIKDSALQAITKVCLRLNYPELRTLAETGRLNFRLRRAARKALTDYGVLVTFFTITDFAPTRVYKLVQSTNAIN